MKLEARIHPTPALPCEQGRWLVAASLHIPGFTRVASSKIARRKRAASVTFSWASKRK
jgi:hypothetical protein